jgi:hypothetical protein
MLAMKPNGSTPSRYDDDDQNVGDENVGVELDGVRHEAGDLSLMGFDCNPTPERAFSAHHAERQTV